MATITKPKLPQPGDRIGAVCGPGEFPKDNQGIVVTLINNQWGEHALVLMDDGRTETCHGLNSGPGIGWHMIREARA